MNEFFIRELKSKITLSDLLSRYIKIHHKGGKKLACCPFHKEKTPSFTIADDKGVYHCFGCGAHGDGISFLQEYLTISFIDALKELCALTNTELPMIEIQSKGVVKSLDIMQSCVEYFNKQLQNNNEAKSYVKSRGLAGLQEKFGIGFGGTAKDGLFKHLSKNFTKKDIILSGVCIESSYGGAFDRFYNRIIFPIVSHSGKVVAFSGRIFNGEAKSAKYINSPETEIFKKNQILYNFHNARKTKEKFAIVCEGFMDVIAFYKDGVENVVAQMGTAFTTEHLKTLLSRFEEISFCLDMDNAGIVSQKKVINMIFTAMTAEKSFSFIIPHGTKDPDEFLQKNGSRSLSSLAKNRIPIHEYAWVIWSENVDFKNPSQVVRLENDITEILKKNQSSTIQQHYMHFFKNKIYKKKFDKSPNIETFSAPKISSSEIPTHEINAVVFAYQHCELINKVCGDLLVEYEVSFTNNHIQNLFELSIAGEDISEDLDLILPQASIPYALTDDDIRNYYMLIYYSSMLWTVDLEIKNNKDNFKKMVFLSKERQRTQKEMKKFMLV